MSQADLHILQTQPTDTQLAEAIRNEMMEPLKELCDVLNRYRTTGLQIGFSVAPNAYGQVAPSITVVRPL